jgi:hypothetical protein
MKCNLEGHRSFFLLYAPACLAWFSCTTAVTLHRLIHRPASTSPGPAPSLCGHLAIMVEGATTQGSATRAAGPW